MNFLRYPLTLKNFFLNQKNPHRAKFLGCRIIRNPNYRNFRFTIGKVHPEPHLMQGSFEPTTASNMTHLPIGLIMGSPNGETLLYHPVTTNEVSPKLSDLKQIKGKSFYLEINHHEIVCVTQIMCSPLDHHGLIKVYQIW